jgi:guanine deaminase
MTNEDFMQRALDLALDCVRANRGGPFGAVIVRDGAIVAEGCNEVTSTCDPSAHAEVVAIRRACAKFGTFHLSDCEIYASCEPCPMCLGAIYWARFRALYYANTREETAAIGFDDEVHLSRNAARSSGSRHSGPASANAAVPSPVRGMGRQT